MMFIMYKVYSKISANAIGSVMDQRYRSYVGMDSNGTSMMTNNMVVSNGYEYNGERYGQQYGKPSTGIQPSSNINVNTISDTISDTIPNTIPDTVEQPSINMNTSSETIEQPYQPQYLAQDRVTAF